MREEMLAGKEAKEEGEGGGGGDGYVGKKGVEAFGGEENVYFGFGGEGEDGGGGFGVKYGYFSILLYFHGW